MVTARLALKTVNPKITKMRTTARSKAERDKQMVLHLRLRADLADILSFVDDSTSMFELGVERMTHNVNQIFNIYISKISPR